MRNPVKRRLAWAVFGACLLAAATITLAQNQGSPGSGEPIELFAKLMPVFTHPRCANCHGGVDPHAESGPLENTHDGGIIPVGGTCADSDCHTQTNDADPETKWQTAAPHHSFVGRTAKELCDMQSPIAKRMRPPKDYYHHLESDFLIDLAFIGASGGANTSSPAPPLMEKKDFLKAARAWVAAGAGCTWVGTIKQTEAFASNYDFPSPGGSGTTTVLQSANRTVIVARDPGSTTADIVMSGQSTLTTVENTECRPTVVMGADWNNDNAAKPAAADVRFQIAADGSYVIYFRGPPEKTRAIDSLNVSSSCGSLLPSSPPSTTDLDWDPWKFSIRCPPTPLLDTARGESIDCNGFDAEKSPRLKGKMTRVVVDHWDAADRQSWLTVSPVGVSRADSAESLPVTVVTEWDFELDKLSPDAKALRQ